MNLAVGIVSLDVVVLGADDVDHLVEDLLLHQPIVLAEQPQHWNARVANAHEVLLEAAEIRVAHRLRRQHHIVHAVGLHPHSVRRLEEALAEGLEHPASPFVLVHLHRALGEPGRSHAHDTTMAGRVEEGHRPDVDRLLLAQQHARRIDRAAVRDEEIDLVHADGGQEIFDIVVLLGGRMAPHFGLHC